ncbi:hypothetical protein BDY19DRAFT_983448 [Irpex rosettiformis]|uniref:Uncharacterized protein n=1 Tax=Irpex rosettiformis TaxID=378272 RepID=A0ACB8UC48_9APHY|nr:hypothetical protein BDY19DRAFT_983448 [Irpex rosettiformis]
MQDSRPDKISAYYSLVFPSFTYYLQTLNVTIGRRCIPSNTASSSDSPQVDVDLGPLKSVSRLHARIEYDEDEERFVLVVVGRNGAWVDGVWSGSGSRVALGDRSQIQIASRTFHFNLPPPLALPEDSPSPSSHSSAGNRRRSPSVDITSLDVTSISPPSSIPPCSPPTVAVEIASPPKMIPPLPQPSLPNTNSITRLKSNKKRKKSDAADALPRLKPEDMPPKPQYTYAQLSYRAIKALGGRASLQDICQWIHDTYDWYKYCNKDWESSVRHNLSSNRAFKKLDRGPDEKGKGALWSIDPQHEHLFEEQDARKQAEGKLFGKKAKDAALLGPPLRRSVKGEPKGAPLPPPLTSTPLVKREFHTSNVSAPPLSTTIPIKLAHIPVPVAHPPRSHHTLSLPSSTSIFRANPINSSGQPGPSQTHTSNPPQALTSTLSQAPSSIPPIPPSVRLPIIVGPAPSSSSDATSNPADVKPIVLHQNTLILNPVIFSHLTPEQVRDLEALGAQKALEILQGYIVRFYKEKLRAEGGRGRGRARVKKLRGGAPNPSRSAAPAEGLGIDAPLPAHTVSSSGSQGTPVAAPSSASQPPMASLQPSPSEQEGPGSPIIVVDDDDDDDDDDAHVSKKPRLGGVGAS